MTTTEKIQPRLKTRYREEIKDTLNKEFEYPNVMLIPGVVKVVVNTGVGEAARDSKVIDGAVEAAALTVIQLHGSETPAPGARRQGGERLWAGPRACARADAQPRLLMPCRGRGCPRPSLGCPA